MATPSLFLGQFKPKSFPIECRPADLANLTDISEEPDLYVQKVIHQAELEVNEEGSEAAAATAVLIGTRTASVANKRPREFKVNRRTSNIDSRFLNNPINSHCPYVLSLRTHESRVMTLNSSQFQY